MKQFIKYTLATVVGIVIAAGLIAVVSFSALVALLSAEDGSVEVKDKSVFVLSLSGTLEERAAEDVLGWLTGDTDNSIGLQDIVESIQKAKSDPNIKGIYVRARAWSCDAPASAQAIRDALADFKASGKWIVSYADAYTQTSFYICSVADKVFLNPQGMIDWHGISSQPFFVKDMLAKVGVKVQMSKVGKYKSYPEMFTSDGMSAPNREQTAAYINNIWNVMVEGVSESRGIFPGKLNRYADSLILFTAPERYVDMKLVDTLLYVDEVKEQIKALTDAGDVDDVNFLTLDDMKELDAPAGDGGEIAVYYAYGDIVKSVSSSISDEVCIASDDVCADIRDLMDDDNVKAVVLRVNSGGGDAYAASLIWRAVSELKEVKPVVVSMGGYAASGGYYISCPANYIYAYPTTVTGSIGIFGMFPDFSELLTDKLGIKFDEVKTNKYSTFGNPSRPFSNDEMARINVYIERGYNDFRECVSKGRSKSVADVEKIAQGRVWTGDDAVRIGLVDELGGLDDAVKKAAELAELDKWHTESYPAMPDIWERLMSDLSGVDDVSSRVKAALGDCYYPLMLLNHISKDKQSVAQARLMQRVIIE